MTAVSILASKLTFLMHMQTKSGQAWPRNVRYRVELCLGALKNKMMTFHFEKLVFGPQL
jgi:hypothetical protein